MGERAKSETPIIKDCAVKVVHITEWKLRTHARKKEPTARLLPPMFVWFFVWQHIHEHALILRIPTCDSEHCHRQAGKPNISVVHLVRELSFVCGSMQ